MNEKIKNHIELLFEKAPKTRKALELKEELLANSEERYQDLIANGVSQEDAIKNVISSIGNVSELFQGLEEMTSEQNAYYYEKVKKAAVLKTVAIGIYLFSIVVFIFFIFVDRMSFNPYNFMTNITGIYMGGHFDYKMLGFILMIIIDIIPTCMLVYISTMYPKNSKDGITVVEEFKEWNSSNKKKQSIKGAVSAVLWAAAVLFYFAISFVTYDWYITWIVFLIALCLQAVIELVFRLKESK